jgi:uncharacterized membrane protein
MNRDINIGRWERLACAVGGGALVAAGLSRRSVPGLLAAAGGLVLTARGLSGRSMVYAKLGIDTTPEGLSRGVDVRAAITIDRAPREIYDFWRQLETLPRFIDHLEEVTPRSDEVSHWSVRVGPRLLEWDAEIIDDVPGERIAWRSISGDVDTDGELSLWPAPGERGTEVHVAMRYAPPGGSKAMVLAPLLRIAGAVGVKDSLRRLKQLLEVGEIATVEGQPSGRWRIPAAEERALRAAKVRRAEAEAGHVPALEVRP